MASLLVLPQELLEEVVKLLDHPSAISLLRSCSNIHYKLVTSARFWRHVCICLHLDTLEWGLEGLSREVQKLRALYCRARQVDRGIKSTTPLQTDRVHLDINSFRRGGEVKHHQKVVRLPEPRRTGVGFMTLQRELIAENIFSVGVSEQYLVVIVSNCQTYKSHVTVWNISQEGVTFSFSLTPQSTPKHPAVNLWVSCSEDVLVKDDLLILLASQAEESNFFNEARPLNSCLLHIFSLSQTGRLVAQFSLAPSMTRLLPLILKEGGGTRLMVWGNLLLAVCPEVEVGYYTSEPEAHPRCVLRVLDLTRVEDGSLELECVFSREVEGVMLKQPCSYMASDQAGPNVIMSFSRWEGGSLNQQIIVMSLENSDRLGDSVRVYREGVGGLKSVPRLLGENEGVRRRQELLLAAGETYNVFALMDSAGLVTTRDKGGVVRQFYPVFGVTEDWHTFFDELHLYQEKVVCLKTFQNRDLGRAGNRQTVLSVSTLEGDLLWRVNIGEGGGVDRFYLGPLFGKVLVSDARKAQVYCLDSGKLLNIVTYPKYKRLSREMELTGDISPYAQTGYSVWDLKRVGDRLIVIHDVERVNPVIADLVTIWG